jgi:hypothetical protein
MTNRNRHSLQTDASHKIADLVSTFVSPPTIAIVATIAFSLWSPIGLGTLSAPVSILLCFLLFAFFPFLPVVYYYRKNVIDLYVSEREARTPFYLVALASYATALILFFVTETKILFLLALGYTVVTAILMVVNFFWKVSTHCAGVSGPIVALIFVFGVNILPVSLILVLLCWSRIKLQNHTFYQTVAGTLISLTVGIVEYSLLYP